MLTPICMLCVVHMISFNNLYETPLLPTEFADARWRNKALLLHPNVRAQHVHLVRVWDTQRCREKIIIKEKKSNNILIHHSCWVEHLYRSNSLETKTWNILCMCLLTSFGRWVVLQCPFMMRQCSTFNFVSLLFITLYLTNVLVSVTSALFLCYDEAEQASSRRHDESQWKIF